jgi:hypothetical protein
MVSHARRGGRGAVFISAVFLILFVLPLILVLLRQVESTA